MGELILSYLKRKKREYLLLICCIVIFAILFVLYAIPMELIAYGSLLCLVVFLLLEGYDFFRYVQKHRMLVSVSKEVMLTIQNLPVPKDIIEEDYEEMVRVVFEDKASYISRMDQNHQDAIDYYTLWAHQIKTPIAAMRLLLQEMEDEKTTELSMELLKIEQYVEMVLQYLRLDSASSDYKLQDYQLDGIIRGAIRKYAPMFIRKKIRLNYEGVSTQVLTDEKWLQFVVEQVLSNALKYTKAGGEVSIYMEEHEVLVISDTGIGIQAEDQPRIFEKGYTGYNGRADKKSTGIGLYLCKRILKQLGHGIQVESEPGVGTRMRIYLHRREVRHE